MYDSYMQATQEMSDAEFREAIWKLRDYAIDGKQEKSKSPLVNMFMTRAQPTVDSARNRYDAAKKNGEKGKEHGWKGGRPKKTPEITPEKPQSKPLNVDVDVNVNENENRDVYVNADTYATGNVDVDRDDSGYEDAYATGNEDDDWDEEDYDDEDTDDYKEEDADWDEETYPSSIDTTSRKYYKDTSNSTTTYPGSKGIDTMRERVKPTFSCEKPNPILPTSKVELQREYETNLSILHQYDLNHQDFDETSRAALRGATNALMKLSNLNFEQAKQVISAARSQYRQES